MNVSVELWIVQNNIIHLFGFNSKQNKSSSNWTLCDNREGKMEPPIGYNLSGSLNQHNDIFSRFPKTVPSSLQKKSLYIPNLMYIPPPPFDRSLTDALVFGAKNNFFQFEQQIRWARYWSTSWPTTCWPPQNVTDFDKWSCKKDVCILFDQKYSSKKCYTSSKVKSRKSLDLTWLEPEIPVKVRSRES